MCGPKLRMRFRMSVIYGHLVMAATRALRFSNHVTKRNGGSGDENALLLDKRQLILRIVIFWSAVYGSILPSVTSITHTQGRLKYLGTWV